MTDCNKDEEGVEVKNSIFKVNQVELSGTVVLDITDLGGSNTVIGNFREQ